MIILDRIDEHLDLPKSIPVRKYSQGVECISIGEYRFVMSQAFSQHQNLLSHAHTKFQDGFLNSIRSIIHGKNFNDGKK